MRLFFVIKWMNQLANERKGCFWGCIATLSFGTFSGIACESGIKKDETCASFKVNLRTERVVEWQSLSMIALHFGSGIRVKTIRAAFTCPIIVFSEVEIGFYVYYIYGWRFICIYWSKCSLSSFDLTPDNALNVIYWDFKWLPIRLIALQWQIASLAIQSHDDLSSFRLMESFIHPCWDNKNSFAEDYLSSVYSIYILLV